MKKQTTPGKLHKYVRTRLLSILLVVSLLSVSTLPERFTCALLGTYGSFHASAATLTDELLLKLAQLNFSDSENLEDLDAELVEEAFKSQHVGGSRWSSVVIPGFLRAVGEELGDEFKEPGKDYLGNDMNASYSMGQLIIDYTRQVKTGAAYLSDDEIVEIYDILVGDDDDADPFVDMDGFLSKIDAAVEGARAGAYADQPVTDVLDRSRYTTYGQYVINRGSPVPAGYLFIGTWLMDAQAINSTFYRAAVYSMGADDQQIMYYKSELAGNNWRNIFGATGLEDILPVAENVQEYTLVDYYVSVVVDSNGVPRWAKTGEIVDIFSIYDPYELETLPELKSLKIQYDAGIVSSSDEGSKRYIYDRLSWFFDSDGKIARNDQMEADCRYVLNVANRTGIAFYAPDWRYTNWYTSELERYYCNNWFWGLLGWRSGYRSGIGITETFGSHQWRFEESGRGFLESIETLAEREVKKNFIFTYSISDDDYKGYYPSGGGEQDAKLIRGWPSWANEQAWVNEVNAFGGIGELRRRIWNFEDVWRNFASVQDEVTDYYDQRLAGLGDIYYQVLHIDPRTGVRGASTDPAEDKELADEVLQICERMDAGRRARAYYNLVDNEQHNYVIGPVLNLLYQWVSYGESNIGRNYQLMFYTDEDFAQVSSITDAVESAIQDCEASYIRYQNLVPTEGNTVISQARYALINSVVDNAANGAPAVRSQLRELVDIENIENHVIAHKSRELNSIAALLDTADTRYQLYLHAASGDAYRSAAADPNATASLLDELLQDQKADVTGIAAELQRLIKARAIRLDTADAISFINERINWAEGQRPGITSDAFGPYANEALDEHIRWLKTLINTIKEGGEITDETDDLRVKKAQLELDLLSALDNGNLKDAESLGRQITEVQNAIDQADKKKRENASGAATAADQADMYNPESPQGVADALADNLLADIGEGNYDPIPDGLKALGDLGSPRIPEIIDALRVHSAPLELIHQAEEAETAAQSSPFNDLYPKDETGGGAGSGETGAGGSGNSDGTGGGGNGGPEGTGIGGNTGTGQNGEGDDNTGGGGDTGGAGTGPGGNGDDSGDVDTGNGFGKDLGLGKEGRGDAVRARRGGDTGNLSDLDKAAAVAALEQFALARDDAGAHEYAMDLVNELLGTAGGFVYRQYLEDPSREYVSLESVDKCRLYTRFRRARERADVTMAQIVQGTASYSFAVGSADVVKNNRDEDHMDLPLVAQTDPYIRGDSTTEYPYVTEESCMKYLYCKCVYLKGTDMAVLVTPQMDSKIVRILDELDLLTDGEN